MDELPGNLKVIFVLFFQPAFDDADGFLLHLFRKRIDACPMASARFHKDVHVFFLAGVQPERSSSRPWVDFTIDKQHLRVVLLQELGDFLAQGLVELDVLGIVRKHEAFQITFA